MLELTLISVVSEFNGMSIVEVPRLLPIKELEFTIDLVPSTMPISRAPYRMKPLELRELKTNLKEQLEKGFIRLSASPWGTPFLLVKKKDDNMRMCIDHRMLNKC